MLVATIYHIYIVGVVLSKIAEGFPVHVCVGSKVPEREMRGVVSPEPPAPTHPPTGIRVGD